MSASRLSLSYVAPRAAKTGTESAQTAQQPEVETTATPKRSRRGSKERSEDAVSEAPRVVTAAAPKQPKTATATRTTTKRTPFQLYAASLRVASDDVRGGIDASRAWRSMTDEERGAWARKAKSSGPKSTRKGGGGVQQNKT